MRSSSFVNKKIPPIERAAACSIWSRMVRPGIKSVCQSKTLAPRLRRNRLIDAAFQADKVAGLEYDIIARDGCFALPLADEVIVLCEQENPADRACGGLFNLVQNEQ